MTLTIPPMPQVVCEDGWSPERENLLDYIDDLISWGRQGWAEAEGLDARCDHLEEDRRKVEDSMAKYRAERDEARAGIDAAYMRGCEVGAKHFGEVERALRAQVKDLAEALENAANALDSAAEDIANWGAYATEYFQEKWDLQTDIGCAQANARDARAALSRLASADQRTTDTSSQ